MDYFVKSSNPAKQRVGCVIAGVFDRRRLSAPAAALDKAAAGAIATALRRGDLDGKPGQTLVLHHVPKISADRVVLVGLGRERDFDEAAYRKACQAAARAVRGTGAIDAVSYLTHLPVKARDVAWSVQQAVLLTQDEHYRFDAYRGDKPRADAGPRLGRLTLDVPRRSDLPSAERGLKEGLAIGAGVALTKNLGNTPPNVCTPTWLAEQAQQLARQHGSIKARVLDRDELEALGMGAFMAVAQGSRQPPKLIVLEYLHGEKGEQPVALVGKGITFDSGGISIKPSDKMDEMKFDMCGGASVLGAFKAVAELKLPLNLVGVVPACENMPGGLAVKPGDIVKSMAGVTIEILNTDAEGRLILCDALTYAARFNPEKVIDIATLTGAIVVALGNVATGLFANDEKLADEVRAAADDAWDRVWQMPLWDDYQEQLRSNFADFANIGGRPAGSITAACFLARFTKKLRWAHLDIAGTAWKGGREKGSTGRPVPLLVRFALRHAGKK